jgi:predicted nucleic acid-binding protein
VALIHARDQRHADAQQTWSAVLRARREVVTTSLVLAESHGLIARRLGVEAGLVFLDAFATPRDRRIVWAEEELATAAADRWLRRYRDSQLSLTDAVSFEVMRREGLRDAFAFDLDFERAGFTVV